MNNNEKLLHTLLTEPLSDLRSLSLNISVKYTDVDGVIIDKATLPAALQTKLPLYLFGEMDRQGGYFVAQKNCPPVPAGWQFLSSIIWGAQSNPFVFGFTGLSDIQGQIKSGDVVTIWVDSVTNPTYFAFSIQNISKASWGSILANTKTTQNDNKIDVLKIDRLSYFATTEQWKETIFTTVIDNIGNYKWNYINPFDHKFPMQLAQDFIEIPMKFHAYQYIGLNTYTLFATESMQLVFDLRVNQLANIKQK